MTLNAAQTEPHINNVMFLICVCVCVSAQCSDTPLSFKLNGHAMPPLPAGQYTSPPVMSVGKPHLFRCEQHLLSCPLSWSLSPLSWSLSPPSWPLPPQPHPHPGPCPPCPGPCPPCRCWAEALLSSWRFSQWFHHSPSPCHNGCQQSCRDAAHQHHGLPKPSCSSSCC